MLPRYHFHIIDGRDEVDDEGTDLVDLGEAKDQAVQMAGQVLQELQPSQLWALERWKLVVSDGPSPAAGITHFTLELAARDGR